MSALSDEELDRYARHLVLPQIGGVGQRRLKGARVVVVGAGGVGSAAIPAFAGAGIGRITIIDDDVVDRSNLQRQALFRDDQVGQSKAEKAAEFAQALNPAIVVEGIAARLDAGNAESLLDGHDLVLDGCDNFATRLAVSDVATRLELPLISAAAAQFQGQIGLFEGWLPDQACYRCFVGDSFDNDDCDTCAERGVLGALTTVVGGFAALLAIRSLTGGWDQGAGKLFLFDGLSLSLRSIRIPKDSACKTCGG